MFTKNKCSVFFLSFFAFILIFVPEAHADVFDKLSTLGNSLGVGLAKSGYLIAGLGLIAFSVAAIFNKISWKTLAYIMMSTFILTLLLSGIIYDSLQVGGSFEKLGGTSFNGVSGSTETGQDTTKNKVDSGHK